MPYPSFDHRPQALAPRQHGGHLAWLAGSSNRRADLLDFSVNLNPYGPNPAVLEAIGRAALDVYPEPTALPARRALAASLNLDPDHIVVGNGAAELLWTLATATLSPNDVLVTLAPTFSELTAAARARGACIEPVDCGPNNQFAVDLDAIADRTRATSARMVYLCTPNNPTGRGVAATEIAELARRLPDSVVVVDQAFLGLSDRANDLDVGFPDNAVAVRSLTKEHTLPGLRVGYAIAGAATAARMEAGRPPWTTSAPTQAAAVATIGHGEFIADSRRQLRAARAHLVTSLAALGWVVAPSEAPFVLLEARDARTLQLRLAERHGVLIRDCTSFGMPGHVRVAIRKPADNQRLIAALAEER